MARTDPQINLRIPQELKARLEEAAKASNRSVNSELVARLRTSLEFDLSTDQIGKMLAAMEFRHAKERFEHLKERTQVIQLVQDLLNTLAVTSRGHPLSDDHLRAFVKRAGDLLDLFKQDDPKTVVAEFNKAFREFKEMALDPFDDQWTNDREPDGSTHPEPRNDQPQNDISQGNEVLAPATPAPSAKSPRRRLITKRRNNPSSP